MSDETVEVMQKLQRDMTKTKKQNMKEFIEKNGFLSKKQILLHLN
jgi:predicted DNA-binding protein